jgi:hypothetical protein
MTWRPRVAAVIDRCVRDAVARGNKAATLRKLGKLLRLSHTTMERIADPRSGRGVMVDLVLSLPRDLAVDVLVALLAMLDEGAADVSTRDTLDAIAIDLGVAIHRLKRDLADGREDEHADHAAAMRRIVLLALRGAAACAGRADAADAGGLR